MGGLETKAARDRLEPLEQAIVVRTEAQASTDERVAVLEGAMSTKSSIQALAEVVERVVTNRQDIARDRATAANALEALAARSGRETVEIRARLDRMHLDHLQLQTDVNKRALASDVLALATKADGILSDVQTRAVATDVQALDFRLGGTERSLENLGEEMGRRALAADLRAAADRVSTLQLQVAANRTQARTDVDAVWARVGELPPTIEALEQRLGKEIATGHVQLTQGLEAHAVTMKGIERRFDIDREKSSACLVALEREVNTKAPTIDVNALFVRLATAEQSLAPLAPAIATKAGVEDVHRLMARTEALESSFATKADAAIVERLRLAVSSHVARHEDLQTRTQDHNSRIEALGQRAQEHVARLDDLDCQARDLKVQLPSKAVAGDVYGKADVDKMLTEVYTKSEIDSQMCQVWWRFGQTGKVNAWSPPKR